jgi:phosphate uptake regulator
MDKFIKQYQLEIKELFERDYHLVDSDEKFVRRLVGLASSLSSSDPAYISELNDRINELSYDLEEADVKIIELKTRLGIYERV